MALSAVALAGRALLKIGAAAIQSFEEKSAEAEVAGALYAPVRDALLSSYPWSFATLAGRNAEPTPRMVAAGRRFSFSPLPA